MRPRELIEHAPLMGRVFVEHVHVGANQAARVERRQRPAQLGLGLVHHLSERRVHVHDVVAVVGDHDVRSDDIESAANPQIDHLFGNRALEHLGRLGDVTDFVSALGVRHIDDAVVGELRQHRCNLADRLRDRTGAQVGDQGGRDQPNDQQQPFDFRQDRNIGQYFPRVMSQHGLLVGLDPARAGSVGLSWAIEQIKNFRCTRSSFGDEHVQRPVPLRRFTDREYLLGKRCKRSKSLGRCVPGFPLIQRQHVLLRVEAPKCPFKMRPWRIEAVLIDRVAGQQVHAQSRRCRCQTAAGIAHDFEQPFAFDARLQTLLLVDHLGQFGVDGLEVRLGFGLQHPGCRQSIGRKGD